MEFQDSYFESEVREGFYVSSLMKRSWAAQLEVLEDVDKVCRRHRITYYADAGTLLGAVRHQGFIPWDDDLDICMMRKDYNRFIAVAEKELPEGYCIRNIHTDDSYTEMFTRVINSRQINFQTDFLSKFHGCPYGMGIDVFVMDYIPSETKEKDFLSLILKSIDEMLEAALSGEMAGEALVQQIRLIENILNVKINPERSWINQVLLLEEKLFSMYSAEEAEEITMMPLWIKNEEYKWPKLWYDSDKIERIPFENAMVPVPTMHDAALEKKYGNYMQSVKEAGTHDYPLFRKQEEALIEKIGSNPYAYAFSEEELRCCDAAENKTVKKQMRNYIYLLNELHDHMKKWKDDVPAALDMLAQCQETAIALGTLLEQEAEGQSTAVSSLESYCELLYQMHEAIIQNKLEDTEKLRTHLNGQWKQAESEIRKEIDLRYEAVFLPYHASLWEHLESIWEAAEEDKDCRAYVMPIPYFYKKPDGSAGEMYDEADQFPDYVSVIRYDAFDFTKWHPDVIYMQNPYDEYDSAISVHPFFYSKNLKKYTDQLVYIPPYLVEEITEEDERAIKNIRHCCAAPGVVHADKVIVQSEKMREIYIDILTDFAGIGTKEKWEEKIIGLGSPKMDQNAGTKKKEADLPEEWLAVLKKPDGSWKKIVLYGINISALLYYKSTMLKKIRAVIAVFKENCEETALLWVPFGLSVQEMKKIFQKLGEEYQELFEQFQKEGWGILDMSGDIRRAVELCDAYYGDKGYAAQFCLDRKVPVMLQNVEQV